MLRNKFALFKRDSGVIVSLPKSWGKAKRSMTGEEILLKLLKEKPNDRLTLLAYAESLIGQNIKTKCLIAIGAIHKALANGPESDLIYNTSLWSINRSLSKSRQSKRRHTSLPHG